MVKISSLCLFWKLVGSQWLMQSCNNVVMIIHDYMSYLRKNVMHIYNIYIVSFLNVLWFLMRLLLNVIYIYCVIKNTF